MNVIKRNGDKKPFDILKLRAQIEFACDGLDVNPLELEAKISSSIHNNIQTSSLQDMLLNSALPLITTDEPDWIVACGRIAMHQLHREVYKNTKIDYSEFDKYLTYAISNGYYRKDFIKNFDEKIIKQLAKLIHDKNDFSMVVPQVLSLRSKYLVKNQRGIIEYPQFADMSSAMVLASIEPESLLYKVTKDYFEALRNEEISLATPFKSNLRREGGNTGSCFIVPIGDSLNHLAKAWADMAVISKEGGGIGAYLGFLRPGGSYSPNIPKANAVTKWVKIINDIAVAVNQRGIRPGAITPAVDWWHMDIEAFTQVKTETAGDLRDKSFDIFPQVIVDDYFVQAKKANKDVYLFDHKEVYDKLGIMVPSLIGEELLKAHELVTEAIESGKIKHFKKVSAKKLWTLFMEVWIEIGDFYISHKDNINISNYLKEAGYIANSVNLCVESWSVTKTPNSWANEFKDGDLVTSSSDGIYHSCNLISINVGVIHTDARLKEVCSIAVRMLDASIDTGTMPVVEAKNSAEWLRNVGIGTVGVADWMAWNKHSYEKEEGLEALEALIERIAYYCYSASIDLAIEKGSYPAFKEANYDSMFGQPVAELNKRSLNGFDWVALSNRIKQYGIRNFLLLAIAPNTSSGIVMNAVASYLPPHNKFNYQTLADMSVPIIPRYLKQRNWYYKGKFQYAAHDLIKMTRRVQRWIDTGISMEVCINPSMTTIKQISDTILEGFESKELKCVYYSLTIDGTKEAGCSDCAN